RKSLPGPRCTSVTPASAMPAASSCGMVGGRQGYDETSEATMDAPLLWHIPLSHFNEKVRWTLDYKAVAHRRRVLGPHYLIRPWRETGQGRLPILWLDGRAIADSTRIIAALEERYPEPPLYPRDATARRRALALEDDFDETLGPALRAAIVTPLFHNDPAIA